MTARVFVFDDDRSMCEMLGARILGFDRKTLYRKLEHYAAKTPASDD